MFENLSDRLSKTLRNISGKGRLTEDNIKDCLLYTSDAADEL